MTYWITHLENNQTYGQSAGIIANHDTARASKTLGFQSLSYQDYPDIANQRAKRGLILETILAPVLSGDLVIVQFPTWVQSMNFTQELLDTLLMRKVRLVAVIHDFPPYYRPENSSIHPGFWWDQLKKFDLIIAPTKPFAEKLREDQIHTPIVVLGMYDYFHQAPLKTKNFLRQIYTVSGNIAATNLMAYRGETPYLVFGVPPKEQKDQGNIRFQGFVANETLPSVFTGGFGIVDLASKDETDQQYRALISPHKFSVYLASGLPVIVRSGTAHAGLVKKERIGLVIDSLDQVDGLLSTVTEEDYRRMLDQISPWQEAIRSGFFTRRALLEAINILDLSPGLLET